ncbi:MAG TPA: MFS transporter [Fimbriimonadaceae bacterium]
MLLIAWLGWVFDIMDTALFNFAKGPMLQELFHGDAKQKAFIESAFLVLLLIGWSFGGLLFGILADKWGRVRTLTVTVLIYCIFTGATALCHTWQEVAVIRFITALGIGGEWAAGAALVAETFPDKARAPGASLLQSAAAFGPWFAAIVNLQVAVNNWRLLFLVGIFPALVTVLLRLWVKEPSGRSEASSSLHKEVGSPSSPLPLRSSATSPQGEVIGLRVDHETRAYRSMDKSKRSTNPILELFGNPVWRRNAIVALLLGISGIAAANNISYWLPDLTKAASSGFTAAQIQARVSYVTLIMHLGTLIGVFLSPWLCERLGRRKGLAIFFVLSPISVALATIGTKSYASLMVLAPLMSLFTIGMSAGFVLYFPELFPTRLRATGAGFAYNTGRILAAGVPLVTGYILGSTNSIGRAVGITAFVPLAGLVALYFAPETRGKPLPE